MERIQQDWNSLTTVHELELVKKYAALGKFITLLVICKMSNLIVYQQFLYLPIWRMIRVCFDCCSVYLFGYIQLRYSTDFINVSRGCHSRCKWISYSTASGPSGIFYRSRKILFSDCDSYVNHCFMRSNYSSSYRVILHVISSTRVWIISNCEVNQILYSGWKRKSV